MTNPELVKNLVRMTSPEVSHDFIMGLKLLCRHKCEDFSINVVEASTIEVSGLHRLSQDDIKDIEAFGWQVGSDQNTGGWARFEQLEYVDT